MLMDNYPVDMDTCDKIAMWGGCGVTCSIYQDGKCEYHKDIKEQLKTTEDLETYNELYNT